MKRVNSNSKKGIWQCYLIISIQIFAWIVFAQPSTANAAEFNIPAGETDELINAINMSNSNTEDGTINLAEGTYLLEEVDNETDGPNGLPTITTKITINGNGSTIERGSDSPFRIFHVAAEGNLTLNNLTVSNGNPSGEKGAFGDGGDGGGIYNLGTLALINSSISGNSAGGPGCVCDYWEDDFCYEWLCEGRSGHGGGIYNLGTLTITNSALSGNRSGEPRCWSNGCSGPAGHGGAIFNGGILSLTESIINENSGANGSGAWYYNWSTAHPGNGGAIYNDDNGTVFVTNSSFSENSGGDGGEGGVGASGASGGGIYNNGDITLNGCVIDNNHGGKGGRGWSMFSYGASGGNGGGIYNNGNVTLTECVLYNNSGGKPSCGIYCGGGGRGGGIYNNGDITLTDCMLNSNRAGEQGWYSEFGGNGGGIYNAGTSTLTNCSLSGNNCGDCSSGCTYPVCFYLACNGGGIYNSGTLILTNSTLSDNRAGICSNDAEESCNGGALYNSDTGTLTNCTVNGNNADLGGGIYNLAAVTLTNSIVANNSVGNCADSGNILSLGHNLFSDETCNPAESDLIADPLLGPLADNGGRSETHSLLPGSPAIDAGENESCPETDQRGIARPQGSACDIGAYEYEYVATIDAILTFFDESVANGTLEGYGKRQKIANFRLWFMGEMLNSAKWYLEREKMEVACVIKSRSYKRCDGEWRPKDFVQGESAPQLADMINKLMCEQGCQMCIQ